MIVKPYTVPFDVLQIEALERRLPRNHPKRPQIQQERKKFIFGQQGEKEVFYQLQFLPEKSFYLFHNLRLFENERVFQMDFLVLHTHFICILEVKHFKGWISFNEIGQLVHETGEIYDNPISQVEKHKIQFQNWLASKNFPIPPIETIVVLGPATKFSQKNSYTKQIHKLVPSSNILSILIDFSHIFPKPVFKPFQMDQLRTSILTSHIPLQRNVLSTFQIQAKDLIKGVLCPNCVETMMVRKHGTWYCPACHLRKSNAHIEAFNDYYFLIGETITINDAKELLGLSKNYIAKYLLKKEGYNKTGKTKGTKYVLTLKTVP